MTTVLPPCKSIRYAKQLISHQNIEGAKGQLGNLPLELQRRLETLIQEQGTTLSALLENLSPQKRPEIVREQRQILFLALRKLLAEARYPFPITNRREIGREIEPDSSEKLDAEGFKKAIISFAAERIHPSYSRFLNANTFGEFFKDLYYVLPLEKKEEFIKECRQKFAKLSSVELTGLTTPYEVDEICRFLVTICPRLDEVSIIRSSITDSGIFNLAYHPSLTTLNLCNCSGFTGKDLQLLKHSEHLTTLKLASMDEITNDDLRHVTRLRVLRALHLEDLNNITMIGLRHLQGCQNLGQCTVKECGSVPISFLPPFFREEFENGLVRVQREQRRKMKGGSLSVAVEAPPSLLGQIIGESMPPRPASSPGLM